MLLNCDLGESYGAWKMLVDSAIMPLLDQANIACGFHAGDPVVMQHAIEAAVTHKVAIGAHPSYPDREGFGRRSMAMSAAELIACIQYQVSALNGMAGLQGSQVTYVKPHGALYNDFMRDAAIRRSVFYAVAGFGRQRLPLMVQAHPDYRTLQAEAAEYGVPLIYEAFADRAYTDSGYLVSRQQAGAVLSLDAALEQVARLLRDGTIISQGGQPLSVNVDTLCVHGDTPGAVAMATQIRQLIAQQAKT